MENTTTTKDCCKDGCDCVGCQTTDCRSGGVCDCDCGCPCCGKGKKA